MAEAAYIMEMQPSCRLHFGVGESRIHRTHPDMIIAPRFLSLPNQT